MYILSHDNRPFATLSDRKKHLVEKAIEEEFLYDNVKLLGEVVFPDWGECREFEYGGLCEDYGEEVDGLIEITKVVNY